MFFLLEFVVYNTLSAAPLTEILDVNWEGRCIWGTQHLYISGSFCSGHTDVWFIFSIFLLWSLFVFGSSRLENLLFNFPLLQPLSTSLPSIRAKRSSRYPQLLHVSLCLHLSFRAQIPKFFHRGVHYFHTNANFGICSICSPGSWHFYWEQKSLLLVKHFLQWDGKYHESQRIFTSR